MGAGARQLDRRAGRLGLAETELDRVRTLSVSGQVQTARTIRSSALAGFAKLAAELGLDPDALAVGAGLPLEAFHDPNLRIPLSSLGRLLMDAAAQGEAPDLGLRLARRRRVATWGVLGLVTRDQATLGDVVTALRRYTRLHTDGIWITVERAGESVELHVNAYETGAPAMMQALEDLSVAAMHLNLSEIMGPAWRPDCVCFRRHQPILATPYNRLFGCEVLFDQAFNGILFPAGLLEAPVPGADAGAAEQAERRAEALLRSSRGALADHVTEIVIRRLPDGGCDLPRVAGDLGLTVRTLQRRLAEEGASFATVLDRAREILSESYVEGSRRPLAEVAGLLGFGSQAAFNHWYKQRYGVPPSARRKSSA